MKQASDPVWEPLVELVGEEVTGDFMWMCEYGLSDGSRIHAYKHIDTRRYIHLRADGVAYAYIWSTGRYLKVDAAEQLQLVFENLVGLGGVTPRQIEASWGAVRRVAAAGGAGTL